MNKLNEYLQSNGIKYRNFAETIGTSIFTLHAIVNNIRFPSMPLAMEIEKKTTKAVTLYDWFPDYESNTNKKKKNTKDSKNKRKKNSEK